MEAYDIIMICVLIGLTLFGLWKGLVWQIAMLASIVVSYFVALKFREPVAPLLSKESPLNIFLAMGLLYIVTSLVIWLVFRMLANLINQLKLTDFNRQLGAVFGLGTGVVACVAITFFAVTLSADAREKVLASRSGYYIAVFLHNANAIMPKELKQVLGPHLKKLEDSLGPTQHPHDPRARPNESTWPRPSTTPDRVPADRGFPDRAGPYSNEPPRRPNTALQGGS